MGPLVNFVICGVQKGGTSALHDYLSDSPDVAFADVKEVHFFDDEEVDWSHPDYGPYHARYSVDVAKKAYGDATPIYVFWPHALERIRAYNPQMKVILLLRDPVERAWSHWRMEFARGVEHNPFSYCIRQGRWRNFTTHPWGHHREFSYVERGYYGEQVERLLSVFNREQVLIATSERLLRSPQECITDICKFLEVEPPSVITRREVHVGADIDYGAHLTVEDRAFLRDIYAFDQQRLQRLTGIQF